MTLERVHPQPLRPWRGPGRWLVLPHLLKGWQRRPSRLPHHSPLFRTERGAAPYKHRRRCEWAEETWPWASPACFSLGDVETASLSQTAVPLVHTPTQPPTPSAAPSCSHTPGTSAQAPSHPYSSKGTMSCSPAFAQLGPSAWSALGCFPQWIMLRPL